MIDIHTHRLTEANSDLARDLFELMAEVFAEPCGRLSDEYLLQLLSRSDFWALAAFCDDELIGGLTAHALPMTRRESSEIMIYDIAVRPDYQRQGVGRHLISTLRALASAEGIQDIFVPADNHDSHALDFYRALGGEPLSVTHFTFGG